MPFREARQSSCSAFRVAGKTGVYHAWLTAVTLIVCSYSDSGPDVPESIWLAIARTQLWLGVSRSPAVKTALEESLRTHLRDAAWELPTDG